MSNATIQVSGVTKSFGNRQVLNGVSLEVPAGKTMALLGRNGAGKTTLIQILLGLIPAGLGSVRILGIDPAIDPLQLRAKVGYLAEDQVMYGWMTPTELCRFLAPFYPTWDAAVAREFLRRFDIPLDTRIDRLSKGQTVKLGLVVALAHKPKVVVLDDPAMGLDPIARKEFNRDLVEHLQPAGCTVLYSSHLLEEVEAVADEVAILDQGRIVTSGSTEALRERIQQVVLPAAEISRIQRPPGLLDFRRDGSRVALVVDGAASFVERLESEGIAAEVFGLSLDEIFEAVVAGRTREWPDRSALVSKVMA